MIASIRRIFAATFVIAVLGVSFQSAYTLTTECSSVDACVAATLVSFNNADMLTLSPKANSTASIDTNFMGPFALGVTVVGASAQYLLLLSVLVLIVLEVFELHYLKQLMQKRKFS